MKPLTAIVVLSALAGIGVYKVFIDLRTSRSTDTATVIQTRTTEDFNKPFTLVQ